MLLTETRKAVGQVLCHDITQIIRGEVKDARFRKGHVITAEDIPVLLSLGKDHVYIWEINEHMLHENDAAEILCDLCRGENMSQTLPKEGKIELIADADGLLLVDTKRLRAVNGLGEMMIATRASGFSVKKGDKLCGTRVIPLAIEKEKMENARRAAGSEPLLKLLPIKPKKYGLVTTGSEVFYGRIKDNFSPVIKDKMSEYGCEITSHKVLDDNHEKITAAINDMLSNGAEIVICTGGMSVDPDDNTPLAIKNTGAVITSAIKYRNKIAEIKFQNTRKGRRRRLDSLRGGTDAVVWNFSRKDVPIFSCRSNIISYGAPVLPGAMFLIAYTADGRPICGLPGCVMYGRRTIFDLVLPMLLADAPVTADWLAGLGNGGLCMDCPKCSYPNCSFGKGV